MDRDDDLRRLHACLGRQRLLLESLAHRLWRCDRCTDGPAPEPADGGAYERAVVDLQDVRRAVHAEELVRALASCAVGTALGLGPEPTLDQVAAAVPAPWSNLLATDGACLRDGVADVQLLQHRLATRAPDLGPLVREPAVPPSLGRFVGVS
jgi:hypothetical protein